MAENVSEQRRRAAIKWIGDREKAGESTGIKETYEALAKPPLFPGTVELLHALDGLVESGYVRKLAAGGYGLTPTGQALHVGYGRLPRATSAIGAALRHPAIVAVISVIATALVARWLCACP